MCVNYINLDMEGPGGIVHYITRCGETSYIILSP